MTNALSGLLLLDYLDEFAWDDPMPAIYEARETLSSAVAWFLRPRQKRKQGADPIRSPAKQARHNAARI